MLTDQDPLTITKPALDRAVLLYILYLLPSGSPARIIWDIHRQVSLVTFVLLPMLIHLGYPQCCVTISLTSSSSFFIVCILLWPQHCVRLTIDTSSTSLPPQRASPLSLFSPLTQECVGPVIYLSSSVVRFSAGPYIASAGFCCGSGEP